MVDYFDIILWPLLAAFVITGIHVYLGLQVVTRGVIFVDLALAQVAALGMTVGVLFGFAEQAGALYLLALGFTFFGALLFSYTRSVNDRVPQEAIIGITYVVSAAAMILLFSKSPEGAEHLNHLLVGSILFVTPKEVFLAFLLYAIIGLFHWWFREQFLLASMNDSGGTGTQVNRKQWDFLFYVSFGFVVTISVKIAGVLLVFSFLIVPAVAALLFVEGVSSRLIFGWIFSLVGSILGMLASLLLDVPTGAAIVVTFGLMLVAAWLFRPKGAG